MSRLLVLAPALLLAAGTAAAQAKPQQPAKEDAPAAAPAAPPAGTVQAPAAQPPAAPAKPGAQPAPASELDPKTQALIQRELEKMKEDLRNEVRAEIQGAQSAAEFLGTVAEGPKLEFFELDGYFRFRGQLTKNADLGAGTDASGYYLYPVPLQDGNNRSTLATANMRLRLEPTLNVSEHVRVRSQVDVLDNYVLGSSVGDTFLSTFSPYPTTFYGSSRVSGQDDPTADRDAIQVKRVWAEIQTPVGLLSFGRMPSQWGLGIMANAGGDIDDDYGDTVDRLQFAIPPVATPIGKLSFVPILDFDAEGVLNRDTHTASGTGQPFDAESGDDARTYALKVARLDTDDEIRRKLERHESSFNFGAYYNYRTQRWFYPGWYTDGYAGGDYSNDPSTDAAGATKVKRNAYAHAVSLWSRWLSGRWRVEGEFAFQYGHVNAYGYDPTSTGAPYYGKVLLRQYGGALQTEFQAIPNKVSVGVELGLASGDKAPGFGNDPDRLASDGTLPDYGSVEGPQFGVNGDHSIKNFRFNRSYQIDMLLWRRILGNLTDARYVRPSLSWAIFPGLKADFAIIYSQAQYAESTPSSLDSTSTTAYVAGDGSKALGIEADSQLTYTSGDGFTAWLQYGILQPFAALGSGTLDRAHALNVGLAAKF